MNRPKRSILRRLVSVLLLAFLPTQSSAGARVHAKSQHSNSCLVKRRIRFYATDPEVYPVATHWAVTICLDGSGAEFTLKVVEKLGWSPARNYNRPREDDEDAEGWAELLVEIDTKRYPDLVQRLNDAKTIEVVGYSYGFKAVGHGGPKHE